MRFIVVPLSTKQCMVYCQRTLPLSSKNPRIDDRVATKVSVTWEKWKASDTKWKVALVRWVDTMLERISYQEWTLKTIPAQSAVLRRLKESASSSSSSSSAPTKFVKNLANIAEPHTIEKIPIIHPSIISKGLISNQLTGLAHRGLTHHWKYFWYSAIGAPLTLPMALVPVVPNVPGFYLLYRAWSNWKAYEGGKHLNYLLKNDQLVYETHEAFDTFLEKLEQGLVEPKLQGTQEFSGDQNSSPTENSEERMIIKEDHIDTIVNLVGAKEMAPELHRAIRQVQRDILEPKEKSDSDKQA